MARPVGGADRDNIFISYRRDDTRHLAGRIYDRLAERFGSANIFMDVDSIEPGIDFPTAIADAVASCDLLLALIGPAWLNALDDRGRPRLDDPNDFVVLEIGSALKRGVRVLPILVDGTEFPRPSELPGILAPLARRHAMRLDHETFRSDVEALLAVVAKILGSARRGSTAARADGTPDPPTGPQQQSDLPSDRNSLAPVRSAKGPHTSAQPPRARVWSVPARNPHFTGRDDLLAELRRRLRAGEATLVVQALYGLGGVGKTQLALEYTHRFAADYDLVWWIDAEQQVLIPHQLATLAGRLGLPLGPTVPDTVDRLLGALRGEERWLLIFDNAERPADIADYQPGGTGHVLITSRYPAWGALGGRLEVDVLTRPETVALLRARMPTLDEKLADQLSAELGDLPLAAAQAAGYLEQTDLPPEDYVRRFRTRRAELLARGDVLGYHGRIDTTWALSFERLRAEEPAAVQLLEIAAFLAPERIPLFLFSGHLEFLAEPLRATAADPDALADTVGALVGYSLARRHHHSFQVHRLVQAVIRNQLVPERQRAIADRAVALLVASSPGDPEDPFNWDSYHLLTSHVLATAPVGDHSADGRRLLLDIARYLHGHGDSASSRAVAQPMLDRWRANIGADHTDTLTAASILTIALNELGESEQAIRLGEDTLQRCRRVLGPDHPTTLWAAAALTAALVGLGQFGRTRILGEDTLQRCRRLLGPDHPTTLWTAVNLTVARVLVGDGDPARRLGEDTLQRCRRVLGPEHPTTLWAAAAQTIALVGLGQSEPARALGEDTLQRGRRVLGADHTTTLAAAAGLIRALNQLGEADLARALGQDTLERSSRVFGPDNSLTLFVTQAADNAPLPADNAAADLQSRPR
ncbi:MAG TPA: FxSxx-COOH system tetratricopeptide repeat protein [Microlunatus sp.]